ncbi:hypothetical protein SpCBS45565_g00041 [Spizellomyces sp. 'palustris']|nr:hypothetical protein SpCBS45565_g00041 [Spizellomyces sp. 'palustris']
MTMLLRSRFCANLRLPLTLPSSTRLLTTPTSHSREHGRSGRVWSWGIGVDGKLGHGDQSLVMCPKIVDELDGCRVQAVSCGATHSVALLKGLTNGQVFAWGSNFYGQAGYIPEHSGFFDEDDDDQVSLPTRVKGELTNEDVVDVVCGDYHTVALAKSGKVYTWGGGLLGNASEFNDSNPQPLTFFHDIGRRVLSISANGPTTAVLAVPSGNLAAPPEVYAWGYITAPNGTLLKATSPVLLAGALKSRVESIVAGRGCLGVISLDGGKRTCTIFGVGGRVQRDLFLEQKSENVVDILEGQQNGVVDVGTGMKKIAVGDDFGLLLQENGTLNTLRLPGTATLTDPEPLQLSNIIDMSIGPQAAVCLDSAGQIFAWGDEFLFSESKQEETKRWWEIWRDRGKDQHKENVQTKSLFDKIVTEEPRRVGVCQGARGVAVGWDHFLCRGSDQVGDI